MTANIATLEYDKDGNIVVVGGCDCGTSFQPEHEPEPPPEPEDE